MTNQHLVGESAKDLEIWSIGIYSLSCIIFPGVEKGDLALERVWLLRAMGWRYSLLVSVF